jgi:hypothetical protein
MDATINNEAEPFRRLYGAELSARSWPTGAYDRPQAEEDLARAIFANAVKAGPTFRSDVRSEDWCFWFSVASLLRTHE